jgi:hypothetical protein
MPSRLQFSQGPLDGAVLEGNSDNNPLPPRIILEYDVVCRAENLEPLGGVHLPADRDGVLRHTYEFNENTNDPCYEWIGPGHVE